MPTPPRWTIPAPQETNSHWFSFPVGKGDRASLVAQLMYMQHRRPSFDPWVRKFLWRRKWLPTSVFLPGEFYGQRSLVGYSPWGHKESDTTEQLTLSHFHKGDTRVVIAQREKLPLWDSPWNCKESDMTEQLNTAHDVWSLGGEDPLEKEITTHLSILVWWILWAEESGRLQSMQSHRVGHDWSNLAHIAYGGCRKAPANLQQGLFKTTKTMGTYSIARWKLVLLF